MGDYLNNGAKIGTCGVAYYATLPMLKALQGTGEQEVEYYLHPRHSCSFAFPFPQYDGKEVGDISNFHDGQRADVFFSLPKSIKAFHCHITTHIHPKGGEGLNLFHDCPQKEGAENCNKPDSDYLRYRLYSQAYHNGELCVGIKCVYCEEVSLLEKEEAEQVAIYFETRRETKYDRDADREIPDEDALAFNREIAKRIRATYEQTVEV